MSRDACRVGSTTEYSSNMFVGTRPPGRRAIWWEMIRRHMCRNLLFRPINRRLTSVTLKSPLSLPMLVVLAGRRRRRSRAAKVGRQASGARGTAGMIPRGPRPRVLGSQESAALRGLPEAFDRQACHSSHEPRFRPAQSSRAAIVAATIDPDVLHTAAGSRSDRPLQDRTEDR